MGRIDLPDPVRDEDIYVGGTVSNWTDNPKEENVQEGTGTEIAQLKERLDWLRDHPYASGTEGEADRIEMLLEQLEAPALETPVRIMLNPTPDQLWARGLMTVDEYKAETGTDPDPDMTPEDADTAAAFNAHREREAH